VGWVLEDAAIRHVTMTFNIAVHAAWHQRQSTSPSFCLIDVAFVFVSTAAKNKGKKTKASSCFHLPLFFHYVTFSAFLRFLICLRLKCKLHLNEGSFAFVL